MDVSFDRKKFKCKFDYCIGNATHISDPQLRSKAQEYKRRLSGAMRSLAGQDIERIPASKSYLVSRKYDGEFALIAFDGENAISLHPSGTVRSGLPCLDETAKLLKKAKVKSCLLGAEYHLIDAEDHSRALEQILRVLRSPENKKALERIGLAVFDIFELDGKTVTKPSDVYAKLDTWFGKGKHVRPAEHKTVKKKDAIVQLYVDWVIGESAEGVVVRTETGDWFKIKPKHNIDVAVIGFSEGTEHRKGLLHDLLVAVVRPDGTYHELTRVGGGFSEADRKEIFKELKGSIVPSEYVAVNNDYVAYEMIKPGPVIEISCIDLIPQRVKGGPVNRMVLEWNGKRYSALSRLPLVSVISPQFVRSRDDKEASPEDTSIKQITDLVPVQDAERSADTSQQKPSKLLERIVYTKMMKGNLMVRKLLMWKTNKEDTQEFPAFVVYLTDFSPNRKIPLERDIMIASTQKAAEKMLKEMSEKYFIGGWEKASD